MIPGSETYPFLPQLGAEIFDLPLDSWGGSAVY
jgi:hypothetical protein